MPGKGDGFLVDDLDADAVKAIVEIAGPGTDSPLLMVELRQLGGTLRERRPGAGALGSLDGSFAFYALGVPMGPGAGEAIESRIEAIKGALAPWSRGKTYLNFAEKSVTIGDAIGAEAFTRLEQVKASVDPDGRFRSGAHVRDRNGRGGRRSSRGVRPRSREKGSSGAVQEGVSREKGGTLCRSYRPKSVAATNSGGIVFVSYEHDGPAGGGPARLGYRCGRTPHGQHRLRRAREGRRDPPRRRRARL